MTGLAEMSCPSCGGREVTVQGGRLVCGSCGWTPSMEWLDREMDWRANAFRRTTANLAAAEAPGGSPIEAMRCEQQRVDLAVELADLYALIHVPVLV